MRMTLDISQSDVAALWEEALDSYNKIAEDVDIRKVLSSLPNTSNIQVELQNQLGSFKEFRHNKGMVDACRSIIAENAGYIQVMANQVASAATAAFPPSSAILVAFTYVMIASKHVSEDYNMIQSFFDMMKAFLRRLALLEGKIPPRVEFQRDLINVFSSILSISALAYSYRRKGRFKAWAAALFQGNDPRLGSAFKGLQDNLKGLEWAIMMQTLRTSIDTHDETMSLHQDITSVRASVEKTAAVTMKTLTTVMDATWGVHEILRYVRHQSTADIIQERQLKSNPSRPANFVLLRGLLGTGADAPMQRRLLELERSAVPDVFQWINDDADYLKVVNNEECLLWVIGASGMGKSTMAFTMFRHLRKTFAGDSSVSVASFFVDEAHPHMCSPTIMLRWCSVRAAEKDSRYCEETLHDICSNRDDEESSEGDNDMVRGIEKDWDQLIASKFSSDSRRRLILVLDGIDKLYDNDFAQLLELFGQIKDRGHRVQIIATCDASFEERLDIAPTNKVQLTKDRIFGDMRIVAMSLVKELPRLQKLRAKFGRALAKKVSARADSFLYIIHAMQRLNGIGHESLIRKEITILPPDIKGIYRALVQDCEMNRSLEDREILRTFLAVVAFAKFKMSLAEAELLIKSTGQEHTVNIDEVFDGPLSRLLCITGTERRVDDKESDSGSSDSEESQADVDQPDHRIEIVEGTQNFLRFRETSLQVYFRQADDDSPSLMRGATEAYATILRLTSVLLSSENQYGPNSVTELMTSTNSVAHARLTESAATFCLAHMLEIDISTTSNELTKVVLESLFNILGNKNSALRFLEPTTGLRRTVLEGKQADLSSVLAALKGWAKRAPQLPSGFVSHEILDWFAPLDEDPCCLLVTLARSHVHNWFSSEDQWSAVAALFAANCALRAAKDSAEVRRNLELRSYLDEIDERGRHYIENTPVRVADAFVDVEKTPSSFCGIAMAMYCLDMWDGAIEQTNMGLELAAVSDLERLRLLQCKGGSFYRYSCEMSDEDDKNRLLREAVEALSLAIDMYRRTEAASAVTDLDRVSITNTFIDHAQAASELGSFNLVVDSIRAATSSPFAKVEVAALRGIIAALTRANEDQKALDVLAAISKKDLADYFWSEIDAHQHVQKAAVQCGQGRRLLDLYAAATKLLATGASRNQYIIRIVSLQLCAADFTRYAMQDAEEAKTILRGVIRDPTAHFLLVQRACSQLAELLLEDFRHSSSPALKQAALAETRALRVRLGEVLGSDFAPAEASLSVLLAHMLRHLGPAIEHADELRATFRSCVARLTDDIGYNDSTALRQLAIVLSCVDGLEVQARVALTMHQYVLDREAYASDAAQGKTGRGASADGDGEVGNGAAAAAVVPDVPLAPPVDEMDEGLLPDICVVCKVCGKLVDGWANGGAYLCVYCIECDICDDCFAERTAAAAEDVKPSSQWRVVCPPGHRHVRAPVEGWRGVRDGVLRIGDTKVHFKDWLADLESAWEGYWEGFWTTKDL